MATGFVAVSASACVLVTDPESITEATGSTAGTEGGPTTTTDGTAATTTGTTGVATTGGDDGPSAARVYAKARCAAAMRCDCDVELLGGLTECEISVEDRFLAWQASFEHGLFDIDCFEAVVAYYEGAGCETRAELSVGALPPGCHVYVGEQTEGQACFRSASSVATGDECQGASEGQLRCVPTFEGFTCHPPEDAAALRLDEGEPCIRPDTSRAPCAAGLYCDGADTGLCRPPAGVGEPCLEPAGCEPTTWCDNLTDPQAPICAPQREAGAQCLVSAACAPSDCVDAVCAPAICHAERCDGSVPQVCLLSDL